MAGFRKVEPYHTQTAIGHHVLLNFKVNRLDTMRVMSYPYQFRTDCKSAVTIWKVELRSDHNPLNDTFKFSIKIKRLDTSYPPVRVVILVSFYDELCDNLLPRIHESRDAMTRGVDLESTTLPIPQLMMRQVATVAVSMTIENCHQLRTMSFAPNNDTDENNTMLSKM